MEIHWEGTPGNFGKSCLQALPRIHEIKGVKEEEGKPDVEAVREGIEGEEGISA